MTLNEIQKFLSCLSLNISRLTTHDSRLTTHDSQLPHGLLKLTPPVFIILKEIETCTSGTQQHNISFICEVESRKNRFLSTPGVHDRTHRTTKCLMDLPVINTHADDRLYLFFDKVPDQRIVISFIHSTQYEYRRLFHAFQCVPSAVHIRCLAVINKFYTTYCRYIFHAVFEALKGLYRVANFFLSYLHRSSSQASSHRVILIVLSF